MVYYGFVSRGCQRCRRRKIKCGQQKPACLNCKKLDIPCPGYRNLSDVIFRDESERIIRKSRQIEHSQLVLVEENLASSSTPPSTSNPLASSQLSIGTLKPLTQSIIELGASFFFANYTVTRGRPFSDDYHEWLTRSYFEDQPNHVLRAAIDAVGMAGISNVSYAPHVAFKSKEQYCKALIAVKQALNDPVQAIADTTFMAVILLGLFEIVNLETWDRYHQWEAHVKAALALLELRGEEQFTRERGGQLYVQIRSHILLACMQQHTTVPPALVQTMYHFEFSDIRQKWRQSNAANPGSISEISLRIVNLHAAFNNDQVVNPKLIRETALAIDDDLETWRAGVPQEWACITVDATEASAGTFFNGKRHIYRNLWIAEVWNNWRMLRILVNQIIVQNDISSGVFDDAQKSLSLIHQFSTELCISIASFIGTPRMISFIRPLYVVSLEELNDPKLRSFAIEQLRRIDTSMGIRQAGLLAETVARRVNGSLGDFVSGSPHLMSPHLKHLENGIFASPVTGCGESLHTF